MLLVEITYVLKKEQLFNLDIINASGWTKADITAGIEIAQARHWLFHTKKLVIYYLSFMRFIHLAIGIQGQKLLQTRAMSKGFIANEMYMLN